MRGDYKGGGAGLLGQRGPVGGALPPVAAQRQHDLRQEPSAFFAPLRLSAPCSSAAAVVAGPAAAAL
jgi:hypothetical protein